MRLESPAANRPAASRPLTAGLRTRKLASAFVISEEYFSLLYGATERSELARLAHFPDARLDPTELTSERPGFDTVEAIFTTWGAPVFDEEVLARFPRLEVVFYAAGTIRGVVTKAFWQRGVRVTTAAIANAKPVAEFTLAAIVFSLKRVWERAQALREHHVYHRHHPPIPGCYGTTIGLLGLGKVGRRVAERLREMDVQVLGFDPHIAADKAAQLGVRLAPLEEIFARADVVSCHLPLLPETARCIDGSLLRRMKPDSTFINTARGDVVNEDDLITVLRERRDLYAVLDTITEEPPRPDHPLLRLPNAIVTPHLAGSMCQECRRMGAMMVDELRRYVAGEPLLGEVREDDLRFLA